MKNNKIREIILGKPLDPLKSETRHSMALVAFLAWIGLGADGLSSSVYGPEETFRALILDYVLTIAISIASGVDALASFLPLGFQPKGDDAVDGRVAGVHGGRHHPAVSVVECAAGAGQDAECVDLQDSISVFLTFAIDPQSLSSDQAGDSFGG